MIRLWYTELQSMGVSLNTVSSVVSARLHGVIRYSIKGGREAQKRDKQRRKKKIKIAWKILRWKSSRPRRNCNERRRRKRSMRQSTPGRIRCSGSSQSEEHRSSEHLQGANKIMGITLSRDQVQRDPNER